MSEPPDHEAAQRRVLVSALAIVLFMAALDQTVVGTALPRIAADLGGLEWYAWVFTAYMLSTTAIVPIAGKLGDLHGRRRLLIIGIVEFLISSGLAGLSTSMEVLIGMRALQGIGAGILVANAQAAVGDLFPPAQLGKYNGMLSGVHALASLAGPLLGGAITDAFGWRWVFLINLPVALLALLVIVRRFDVPTAGTRRPGIDLPGAVLLVVAVAGWLMVFNELGAALAGQWTVLAVALAVALSSSVAFVIVELRSEAPLLPLPLIAERELRVVLLLTFATGVAIFSAAIYTPLMLQGAVGLSPSAAGLALTPMVFGLVTGGVVGGIRISRVGRCRGVIAVGLSVATLAAGLLAHSAAAPRPLVVAGWLGALGIGVGLTLPALMSAAQNAVKHSELGVATSLSKFARNLGGIVGLGVLGAFLQQRMSGELARGLPQRVGIDDPELVRTLSRDPSVLLRDSPSLAHPLLDGSPARMDELLALLRESLAHASASLLWVVAAALGLALLLSARAVDRPLRDRFEDSA